MRPSWDAYFMCIAEVVSTRSTCLRRAVGCVLVDGYRRILSTGYNGVASGQPHCNEPSKTVRSPARTIVGYPQACEAAFEPSGTNLDGCNAIHAEQNALVQCREAMEVDVCYVTTQPCANCLKLLLVTGCRKVVYRDAYPAADEALRRLWLATGRTAVQFGPEDVRRG